MLLRHELRCLLLPCLYGEHVEVRGDHEPGGLGVETAGPDDHVLAQVQAHLALERKEGDRYQVRSGLDLWARNCLQFLVPVAFAGSFSNVPVY